MILAGCAVAVTAAAHYRVAVVGGSGFIGSHVCKALVARGCSVTSISRNGADTPGPIQMDGTQKRLAERFRGETWIDEVNWFAGDASNEDEAIAAFANGVDGVVCCVGSPGVLKMSKEAWNGNKWSEESLRLYAQNHDANGVAAAAAKKAGAQRCALIGVSSDTETGFGGTQPGLFKGKRDSAADARAAFGDALTYFGPHQVVGSQDFRLKALDSGWARGLIALNKAFGELGYRGEDYVTRARLTPPVSVDDLATAIAAAITGAVEVEPTERCVIANDGGVDGVEICTTGRYVDGTAAIAKLAAEAHLHAP